MKIGFIGAGNMGFSIISALLSSGKCKKEDIYAYDKSPSTNLILSGVNIAILKNVVENSDYIILCVKPNQIFDVLGDIKKLDIKNKVFISIAAGVKIKDIIDALNYEKVIRVMPNLCLKVGEGMSVISVSDKITEEEKETALSIFSSCGKAKIIKEELIDASTSVNGSGPAYVFMMIDALSKGLLKHGLDLETAYEISAQTVLGSAKMVLMEDKCPEELKDMVCSPGGTTIEAVCELEKHSFKSSIIDAVDACVKKAQILGKK